jgi:hypothetical protein
VNESVDLIARVNNCKAIVISAQNQVIGFSSDCGREFDKKTVKSSADVRVLPGPPVVGKLTMSLP